MFCSCWRRGCGWSITAHNTLQGPSICVSRLPVCLRLPCLFAQAELFSVHSTLSLHKVQSNWVPIPKLKSYPRTACSKLHPGDLDWSFVCSQTLQTLVYRQSPGSLPQMASLVFPLSTREDAAHCCPDGVAVILEKNTNLVQSLPVFSPFRSL